MVCFLHQAMHDVGMLDWIRLDWCVRQLALDCLLGSSSLVCCSRSSWTACLGL